MVGVERIRRNASDCVEKKKKKKSNFPPFRVVDVAIIEGARMGSLNKRLRGLKKPHITRQARGFWGKIAWHQIINMADFGLVKHLRPLLHPSESYGQQPC
jgi:hypothetical protein